MESLLKSELKKNALLVRVNCADLKINDMAGKLDVIPKVDVHPVVIEFKLDNNEVPVYIQSPSQHYNSIFDPPVKVEQFKANAGKISKPTWMTKQLGTDWSDGDVWIPVENTNCTELTITITCHTVFSKFCGFVKIPLDKTFKDIKEKEYNLCDNKGSIKLGYKFGTVFEVTLRTGDPNYSVGTGVEPGFLDQKTLSHTDVVIGGLYEKLRSFNPFQIGKRDVLSKKNVNVMVQINGITDSTRFYICKPTMMSEEVLGGVRPFTNSKFRVFAEKDIGYPIAMQVYLSNVDTTSDKVTWLLEKATLDWKDSKPLEMPCYEWVTTGKMKTIATPFGILPQTVTMNEQQKKLYEMRLKELEVARSVFQWEKQTKIPSFLSGTNYGSYDLLPLNEQFDDYKTKDFSYLISMGAQNLVKNAALNIVKGFPINIEDLKIHQMKSLNEYYELYNLVLHKDAVKPSQFFEENKNLWLDDKFFAWTFLAGTNPMRIELCKEVPKEFTPNCFTFNIQEACKDGRVFIVDYSELAQYDLHTTGVKALPELQAGTKYACPCKCIFYVNQSDEKLVPVAIQLIPGGPVFTPKDTNWQWMYAKMAVHNADVQFHQVYYHWLQTHAIAEPISIAMHRNLSRLHPVFRLMFPHFKYSIAINVLARKNLIIPGGFVEKLLSIGDKLEEFLVKCYEKWDFSQTDFPARLQSRGFTMDAKDSKIKDYPYRDDGVKIWNAMFDFVGEYLRLYYKNDDDVKADIEIQNWIKEIREVGHFGRGKTFYEITSIPVLQKFLTTLMWTVSCQHSVINFNQRNMYGFIPNYPGALYKQPPKTKEEITEQFIMDSLPGAIPSSLSILVNNVLSSYAENEEYLTSKRYMEMIGDKGAIDCLKKYQEKLNKIDEEIETRNVERVKNGYPEYTVLMPSKIPNSIAI